ncbi:hypothetical protein BT96DRAFT_1081676 [Gymnopus androsaceus JB14]|uniref:Uncharacterized protein n=1 Tax=Gymnopus androsaceus JB14 TaxID=1447944 RepID=A0A6A4GNH5_9AGAR|nr:hypothetical protein BT96DRAFT_1081676 [Gymnopus androsaceus JB14]
MLNTLQEVSSDALAYFLSRIIALCLLTSQIKNNILLLYPSDYNPYNTPPILPKETKAFFGRACKMKEEDVEACWDVVKDVVWQGNEVIDQVTTDDALNKTFQQYGGIGERELIQGLYIGN